MSKARILADFISDGNTFADGTISVSEVSGAAPIASPTFTGTATIPTAAITTADFGDWTVTESGGSLYFASGGTNYAKLDSSGNLDVVGSLSAHSILAGITKP
jgi:hypothetical protein